MKEEHLKKNNNNNPDDNIALFDSSLWEVDKIYIQHYTESNLYILYDTGEKKEFVYCEIDEQIIAKPFEEFLLIGEYFHVLNRSVGTDAKAKFFIHKPTDSIWVLYYSDYHADCFAIPFERKLTEVISHIQEYEFGVVYKSEIRKYKIESIA